NSQQQNLDFMHQAQTELKALGARDQHGDAQRKGKSLLALADASARSAQLGAQIKRIEPLDQKRVRIEFARVDFDVLAGWLQGLQRSYGIRAQDVSITRVQGIGLVNAHLTLQEP
ncbi:MAG: type II secretion system protein M, partial [Xanthomonadales bacterium]|nr:type II secretion system protein M [Xanthomonadales bacterium]